MTNHQRSFYIFFSILNGSALVTAFYLCLNNLQAFFSYFTVLSNILMTVLFIYLALYNPKKVTAIISWLRGAAVLYMTMTGIIYWSMLANTHSLSIDPWINFTLHGIMPIASFLSWILYPLNKTLSYSAALQWLVFPVIFAFLTLIRGHSINWYPYFFLNPAIEGSYLKVGLNILGILLFSLLGGLTLIWISKRALRA